MSALLAGLLAAASVLLALPVLLSRRRTTHVRAGRGERLRLLSAVLLERLAGRAERIVELLKPRDAQQLIAQAGLSGQLSVRQLAAGRLAAVLFALPLALRLALNLPPRQLIFALPLLFWAASALPLLLISRRAAARARELRATLPDALDLLRACLGAGLPLRRALALAAGHCREPVASEFAQVSAETAFGVPQGQAFAALAERCPLPELRALVAAVAQAERSGAPLAPVIAAQAHDARLALNRMIVERGARAGPKIQLVVSLLIVPAALIAFAAIVTAGIARGTITFL